MKIADRKPVLSVAGVEVLPEFGKLNERQRTFIKLLAAGAEPLAAVAGAYNCKSRRSGERFLYDLLNRRKLQPVLHRLYGLKADDKAEFLKRIEKLIRRGSAVTAADVDALVLYGIANDFLPLNYSPTAELAKLGKV
jgi:hypothetical protein